VNVEDFEKTNWSRTQGLTWMLFEDDERYEDVRSVLNHGAKNASQNFVEKYEKTVALLDHLRTTHSCLRKSIKIHPVFLMRLLLTSSPKNLLLSDRFLKKYAAWRHRRAQEFGGTSVVFTHPSSLSEAGAEPVPIDYFLHSTSLEISFDKDLKVELVGDLGQYEEKSPQENSRSTAEIVGRVSMAMIKACIEDAIKNRAIESLGSVKTEERFVCSLTREELAKELQKRYERARSISIETIIRGVGNFVLCSYRGL